MSDVITGRAAIEVARRKRKALHEAMVEFEAVLTSPWVAPSWVEDLARHLRALELALDDHIREVESDHGIIAQILQDTRVSPVMSKTSMPITAGSPSRSSMPST